MAGLLAGSLLILCSIWDRHIGNNSSSDIELCCGLICYVIQYGINSVIEAIKNEKNN